ncbi:hypothetical protein BDF19DRAFT_454501 [Syncephalis fuscata]|nr:hypothetical protein BDF19DRAFT_454501 [Syncephalis fuscata]
MVVFFYRLPRISWGLARRCLENTAKSILCYISKVNDPWSNLAVEEWLVRHGDPASYVLFMYRNKPCVIFGRNQNPWAECNLNAMSEDGWWGAVYHDMGNTNYCVMMPRKVFKRQTHVEMVTRALNQLDIPAVVNERYDIAVHRPFKLISDRAYHHGTMLIDTDLDGLGHFLRSNKTRLDAAGTASVRSPVTNLRNYSYTVDHLSFCEAVHYEFLGLYGDQKSQLQMMIPIDETFIANQPKIQEYQEQLKTWDWTFGQTPKFTHTIEHTFDWAQLRITLRCSHGRVTDVDLFSSSMIYLSLLHQMTAKWRGCRYDGNELVATWDDASVSEIYAHEEIEELRDWCLRELS